MIAEDIDIPRDLEVGLEDRGIRLRDTVDIFTNIYDTLLNTLLSIAIGVNIIALILISRVRTTYKV
jgi:hypothetical protein